LISRRPLRPRFTSYRNLVIGGASWNGSERQTESGMDYVIQTRTVSVGGLAFTADVAGPADGSPVLLLHGFPQSRHAWRRQLPVLAQAGYRAIAIDQRGYSTGARPAGAEHYTVDALVGDALAVMDAVDAPRFHLVGHDWGGQIAWTAAAQAPQRIISLSVLSRPHPAAFAKAWSDDPEQSGRSRHHSTLLEPGAADAMLATGLSGFRAMFERQGVPAADAQAYIAALSEPGALEAAIHWYRSAAAMRSRDFPRVTTPTLYLWGDADAPVGRAAAAGTGAFVDAPYRFEVAQGARHFLTDQVPQVVNRALLEQLRANS
jgi:pimeloyl-ACP methyl ester carboxylesterase